MENKNLSWHTLEDILNITLGLRLLISKFKIT
jgi:hypothetical protein